MRILAISLAVVFFAAAAIYLLPHGPFGFHVKHALLCGVLGALALLWLRFQVKGAAANGVR
ncbi:MAG TPA: hypothetical protein VKG44_00115 [Candidatus Baltobacteraceae bacterium]|nr:hypothetical protein [Candidatus Baltobacteraceae bacterium]